MKKWGLFHKFAVVILVVGLFPMFVLSVFVSNGMMTRLEESVQDNYEQAVFYVDSSLENIFSTYNEITKTIYQYAPSMGKGWSELPSDNLRQVLNGECFDPKRMRTERNNEMEEVLLKNLQNVDSYIYAAHFVGFDEKKEKLDFHYSARNTFFKDEKKFEEVVGWENWDRNSKKLLVVPPHINSYYNQGQNVVFSLARNYFDTRGSVGREKYVGTLFLDIDIARMKLLFKTLRFSGQENYYVIDKNGYCLLSDDETVMGNAVKEQSDRLDENPAKLSIKSKPNKYGLQVIVTLDRKDAFAQITRLQKLMYLILAAVLCSMVAASLWFSKRLTRPLREMMGQMTRIETGNFDIEIPVRSKDETGVLAERFNQMSVALKKYINQSYVAQIKQNEAELTALKSQIYPHFLYNTLEIIRMSALENGDMPVSRMIEALSRQIHYLIGPMQDMVPLEKEIEIINGYVYLLNCRIAGKVQLVVNGEKISGIMVPKLTLQPIVENAYVHGIKPKSGSGSIMVEIAKMEYPGNSGEEGAKKQLEITVMDNGVGMGEGDLARIQALLDGDEIGIKNEYNWQSVGMKNVHDRIRFLYGEEYGVKVVSTPGVGTMVRLLMPWVDKEENYAENDIGR